MSVVGDLRNEAKVGHSFTSVLFGMAAAQCTFFVQPTRLTPPWNVHTLQGEYDKAYPLYQRALRMDEKIFGPDNPEVATDLNNLATLLEKQVGFWRNLEANLCYGSSNEKCHFVMRSYRTGVVEGSLCDP